MRFFQLISFVSVSWFFAIEFPLKQLIGKHESCGCRFVDYVYVINLDQRPEKYEVVRKQLEKNHIKPYRMSAVNGWELSSTDLESIGIEYQIDWGQSFWGTVYRHHEGIGVRSHDLLMSKPGRYFSQGLSRGAIGVTLSHLSVIQDALDSGYERIWIMEDDIAVKRPISVIGDLLKELDKLAPEWDLFYTDLDTYNNDTGERVPCFSIASRPDIPLKLSEIKAKVKRHILSKNLIKMGNRYGTYSYILKKSGMRKILKYFKCRGIFLPLDMEFIYIHNLTKVATRKDYVSTILHAPTDNSRPNYLFK